MIYIHYFDKDGKIVEAQQMGFQIKLPGRDWQHFSSILGDGYVSVDPDDDRVRQYKNRR